MELFERIRYLAKNKGFPLSKMAEYLGQSQQNFNKWLNKKAQRRLWEYLPQILELFPDVRPEWLYIGQEPAFLDGTQAEVQPTRDEVERLKRENERLKNELAEADRLNRQLTTRLLLEGDSNEESADAAAARAAGQE